MKTILLFVTDGVAWVDVQNYLRGLHKQQSVVVPLVSTRAEQLVRYGRRINHNVVSIMDRSGDAEQLLQNLDMLRVCDRLVAYVNEDQLGKQESRYRHMLKAAEKKGIKVLVYAYDKSGEGRTVRIDGPATVDKAAV